MGGFDILRTLCGCGHDTLRHLFKPGLDQPKAIHFSLLPLLSVK